MKNPLISVIIITWNRRTDVLETIQSVYDQAYQNFEIIVVDNGSTDDTVAAIHYEYPLARVIALNQNTGIAARNDAIRIANGDIIFCLDSDASLDKYTLENIVYRFEEATEIGIINSRIVNASTRKFDPNGGWSYSAKQRAMWEQEFMTHNFSEGGCAIRKEVFAQTGLFWEKLFFGREGEEFGLRALDAGYKILYYPSAIVYHRVPPQKRPVNWNTQYYDLRNSLYIYFVRYPWWILIWFAPLKICASLLRGLRRRNLQWFTKALQDVIRELPALWKERRPIRRETARRYLQFQQEQGALSWGPISWLHFKT